MSELQFYIIIDFFTWDTAWKECQHFKTNHRFYFMAENCVDIRISTNVCAEPLYCYLCIDFIEQRYITRKKVFTLDFKQQLGTEQ